MDPRNQGSMDPRNQGSTIPVSSRSSSVRHKTLGVRTLGHLEILTVYGVRDILLHSGLLVLHRSRQKPEVLKSFWNRYRGPVTDQIPVYGRKDHPTLSTYVQNLGLSGNFGTNRVLTFILIVNSTLITDTITDTTLNLVSIRTTVSSHYKFLIRRSPKPILHKRHQCVRSVSTRPVGLPRVVTKSLRQDLLVKQE